MKDYLKRYWIDAAIVALFALVSFVYFMPADIEGRILYRHDSSAGRGAGQEQQEYLERTGERTRWTNSTFGGMPTYQTAPSYSSTDVLSKVMTAYHLWLPENVWYVFAYLLGFYILLRAFDFRRELAALGSILWAFSSYFLIIIAAGHIWKVWALAYLPPMIAGVVLAYRGKYLWGFVLTAVFTAFEVKANHVQMTYYFLFVIAFMVVAWLVEAIKNRTLANFFKATAVSALAALLGISINLSSLYHTWQYSKESMRGASELVKKDAKNQTSSGLDRDYITQWSYGIDETWTLLVPNAKGGASMPLTENETAMGKADPRYYEICGQLGQYWGEQPGTSGPVYVGAFVVFLFVLSWFVVKGPLKWALLGATALSVLLAWGKNFMPFTDFFLDYVPMYAKFRTVASILVIAEFTIPLLAMMALKRVIEEPELLKKNLKYVYCSFALTAGVAALMALCPLLFFDGFISEAENEAMSRIPQDVLVPLKENISAMREAMLTADCWRSFLIITVGTLVLLLFKAKYLGRIATVAALALLCLIDLWQVDKRYLNDSMFVEESLREAPQEKTPTDEQILRDTTLDYRVLNFASNTFNENETSYYHKSIGGYHAAKLRRYQEMIDQYILPEMKAALPAIGMAGSDMTRVKGDSVWPVLNMLNTRYFILPLQGGQTVGMLNPYAMGNAWIVDKVRFVDNANQEIEAVGKIDLEKEAVADKKFAPQLELKGQTAAQNAGGDTYITLKSYEPNALTYELTTGHECVVVFSEIYYPGWTATIDGNDAELGRVNYILRALRVEPGIHTVCLTFKPKSISHTETVAYISYAILLLLVAAGVGIHVRRKRKNAN